jgi:hypothetical protein
MNGRATEWQLMQFCCCASASPAAASACAVALTPIDNAANTAAAASTAYDIDFILVSAGADARLVVQAL